MHEQTQPRSPGATHGKCQEVALPTFCAWSYVILHVIPPRRNYDAATLLMRN